MCLPHRYEVSVMVIWGAGSVRDMRMQSVSWQLQRERSSLAHMMVQLVSGNVGWLG